MIKRTLATLLLTVAACAPPPPAPGAAPEPAPAVQQPAFSYAGTLDIFKRIKYTRVWDGVLNGSYGSDLQSPPNGAPPAVSLICPRMHVMVARKLQNFAGEWRWDDNQYDMLVDPTARGLDSEPIGGDAGCSGYGGFCSRTAINPTFCDYKVCAPGTSVQTRTCQPLQAKAGYTTIWMWPACPGDPNHGVGGIAEFNGTEVFVGHDKDHIGNPTDLNITMPQWAGPFGAKRMWKDFAFKCGMNPANQWFEPSTTISGSWCFTGEQCTPMGPHHVEAAWNL